MCFFSYYVATAHFSCTLLTSPDDCVLTRAVGRTASWTRLTTRRHTASPRLAVSCKLTLSRRARTPKTWALARTLWIRIARKPLFPSCLRPVAVSTAPHFLAVLTPLPPHYPFMCPPRSPPLARDPRKTLVCLQYLCLLLNCGRIHRKHSLLVHCLSDIAAVLAGKKECGITHVHSERGRDSVPPVQFQPGTKFSS